MKATPRPWKAQAGSEYRIICENGATVLLIGDNRRLIPSNADEEFMLRAVNSHEELVKALRAAWVLAECLAETKSDPQAFRDNNDNYILISDTLAKLGV